MALLQDNISKNVNNLLHQKTPIDNKNIELQEQSLIDQQLINAGLPENKINNLIDMVKDKLSCDSECQKQRMANNYKEKWELAKKNYRDAPEEIKQAEKNYYIYDKGYPAYKDMLYDRYAKSAAEFKQSSNMKYKQINKELSDLIDNYELSVTYLRRMNDLLKVKLEENEVLKRDIDQYIDFTQTNGRKVIYEDRARDWLGTFRNILLLIYFLILLGYIVLGQFIPRKDYLQWKLWVIIIFYAIFPFFILDWVVRLIFFLSNYITSWSLHKNIYKNL